MAGQNPPAVSTCHGFEYLIGGFRRVPAAHTSPKWASGWTRFDSQQLPSCELLDRQSWGRSKQKPFVDRDIDTTSSLKNCLQINSRCWGAGKKPTLSRPGQERISAPLSQRLVRHHAGRLDLASIGECLVPVSPGPLSFFSLSLRLQPSQIPPLLARVGLGSPTGGLSVSEETKKRERVSQRPVRFPCPSRQTRWCSGVDADTQCAVRDLTLLGTLFLRQRHGLGDGLTLSPIQSLFFVALFILQVRCLVTFLGKRGNSRVGIRLRLAR